MVGLGGYMKDRKGRRLDSFEAANIGKQRKADLIFSVRRLGVTYAKTAGKTIAPYWPQIIKVEGRIASPLGKYYRLRSTDHASGAGSGGLWVDYADSPDATVWTPMNNNDRVYVDTVLGQQSETWRGVHVPHLDAAQPFYLYYQQAGAGTGQQQTVLVKTADFVTFTRVGVVLDVVSLTEQPGDGHSGYFEATLHDGKIVGPHLRGGSIQSHSSFSESYDGVTFHTDTTLLGYRLDYMAVTGNKIMNFINCTYVEWRGQMIMLGTLRTLTGTGGKLAWAPVSRDLRKQMSPPRQILTPTQSYETDDIVSTGAYVDGDRIIVMIHYDIGQTGIGGDGSSGTDQAVIAHYELTEA